MPGPAEENDLGRRICGTERVERGEREHEVAERVRAEDGDPVDVGHDVVGGEHPRTIGRGT